MQTDTMGYTDMAVINFHDWSGNRSTTLQVPRDASVAEVVEEARVDLGLAGNVPYHALHDGRQLDGLTTLRDSGVETDADIDLAANVRAG